MDTITHAIVGATVARATAPASAAAAALGHGRRTVVGALAAAFPDTDYLTVLIDPLAFIAEWHRSVTHSIVMLPLWAVALGTVLAWALKSRRHWREIVVICALSLGSHIVTDAITSWKTLVLAPLSDYWMAWGLTFVIDPWFTAIVLAALVLSIRWESRRAARAGIVVLAAYVGMHGVLKAQAHAIGDAHAASHGWRDAVVHTVPQPLSPFNWKVVIAHGGRYSMALVNLLRTDAPPAAAGSGWPILRLQRHYRPKDALQWMEFPAVHGEPWPAAAWAYSGFERYRRFAVLPYLYHRSETAGERCSWFADLRFWLPEMVVPFRYGVCHEGGQWRVFRLTGGALDTGARAPIATGR